jgi:hypothetical protein
VPALGALPPPGEPLARDWSAAWRVVRGAAAVLGTLAAALAVFGFLFGVLGAWTS